MSKLDLSPNTLRKNVINLSKDSKSGHLGCALSLIEIISALYDGELNYNQENPRDENRDILALSKGHGVMAIYAAFYQLGWINDNQVDNYLKDGTELFGLSEDHISGIEISGGSLGHGLPVATGMAYGFQRRNSKRRVFCIVGDGELNEGSMWEAILFAGHHKLDNLCVIVDANKYQAMGLTEDIIDLNSLEDKFNSFGFDSFSVDGHSLDEIRNSFKKVNDSKRPTVIIANTIKGAGISYMENENIWHYKKMTKEEETLAIKDLSSKEVK
ncbi:transketolase [Halobacteriovorax sp. JY17]|uniref:transketolase n=1 Tax=Halobacteriovorax sp. JY17 TaxID=2014617 RepID=UPI0025C22977|nr:transketolase [Halobacteriovorax sp. JY17]